ncbi:signal peptide, CUB and EGF-like domain-containing protein 1 [Ptychodera flava]|uniref:signal peptide, CUB and EGF-like domain-containing protein 1 n=1 Tax=Ptychodera flava TaxID=63121 RepID=UPI003969C809
MHPEFFRPTCDIDVDECLTNNGGCDHSCINNRGSYSCVCQVGYILAIDAHSCVDADECIESNGGCDHVCDNTAGSFRCSCREGFILDENGSSCTLHNQCASMTCQQHCVNILGRGICYCDLEYYLNDDGVSCNAICSPRCENGGRCMSPNVCECTPNFSGSTCDIDVDECLTNNGGCDHSCFNNRGSYSCVCQVGYILAIDAHSCVDADECIESNGGCDHVCDNTAGSFGVVAGRASYLMKTGALALYTINVRA